MQQTGTLRKRRKRNLTKVTATSVIPYDEENDVFDDRETFNIPKSQRKASFVSFDIESVSTTYGTIIQSRQSSATTTAYTEYPQKENDLGPAVLGKKNNYLLTSRTLNRIRQILIIGALCGAFPWKWNKEKMRVDLWSSKYLKAWKIFWVYYTIQITCITMFQFYSFALRLTAESGSHSFRHIFQSSFSVYWYVCAVYFNVNMYFYKEQMREYINTMLFTNKLLVEEHIVTMEGFQESGNVLVNYSIPMNLSQILASVTFFCIMPYQPWYLFSYIYEKNQPWFYRIPGAIQEFNMAGNVITSYVLTAWIVAAHTNTVKFWLMEIHRHNDSGYTKNTIRHPVTATKIFRSLEVLCNCFNTAMSPLAIPTVKLHTITGLIPCFYILIRSMNHLFIDEFPGILTFPIGVFNTTTAGFGMLNLSAEMHDLAISFSDSWGNTKHKNLRRILKSFSTLKVKVASFYYITPSTTITFFKVTTDYVIDCIITFP